MCEADAIKHNPTGATCVLPDDMFVTATIKVEQNFSELTAFVKIMGSKHLRSSFFKAKDVPWGTAKDIAPAKGKAYL